MRKHLLTAFVLGSLISLGQAPAIQWQKNYGGSAADKANSVQQTSDGGYIMAGETTSTDGDVTTNNGTSDYWVVKTDASGALQWQKNLGGPGDDRAYAITQTSDGGYMVVGTSNSSTGDITTPKGQYDFWIVKLTSTGTISWQKNLGGTAYDDAYAVQQTSDGGYIIAGDSRSNNYDLTGNNGNSDFWVVKTDGSGVIQWQKNLGGSGNDIANSVQQTSDGGYIVAGQTASTGGDVSGNNGGIDYWVVKLSSTGTLTWQKSLGGTLSDMGYSVKQTSDGGYIVAGAADSNNGNVTTNNGVENAWVVKLTSAGAVSWQKNYGGNFYDGANSIQQTSDGGYVFLGAASSNTMDVSGNHGSYDYWVVKITSTGTISWQKCLGGSGSDTGTGIQQTSDGGYIMAGRSASSNGDITNAKGGDDFWLVRFAGTGTPSGINQLAFDNLQLGLYPNPAKGAVTLVNNNSLFSNGQVRIVNTMGQLVYQSAISEGTHNIDLSGIAAKGIYFVQVSDANGANTAVQKLVIE